MDIELLVRAVIQDGEHTLVARMNGAGNTHLPGGHLEHGESLRNALERELKEELGVQAQIGVYLGAVEHAWVEGSDWQHEINHCFAATSEELRAPGRPEAREEHVEFFWHTVEDFEEHNLQPAPLRTLILGARDQTWWGSTIESKDE